MYICKQCGREHVCDDSCKERVLDTANGMPVCPISGMCFDQLDVEWEVRSSMPRLTSLSVLFMLGVVSIQHLVVMPLYVI